jgi:hypothetical protein
MRDNPIVVEDWMVGVSKKFKLASLQYIDYLLTVVLVVTLIIIGSLERIGFIVFISIFLLLGLTFLEIFVDSNSRSIIDRFSVLIGLFFLLLILPIDFREYLFYEFLILTVIILKIILIPIIVSNNSFNEEILIPRSKTVEAVLKDHVDRLESTDFALEDQELIKSSFYELFYSNSKNFIIPVLVALGIYILFALQFYNVVFYLIILVYFLCSLSFLVFAITWFRSRRKYLNIKYDNVKS